ncbi:hypothetical protein AB0L82_32690 [Nocardia sp. NPDC052001]|uniref:hypothetical protein n=1 Tax=Nocardia sp. NPDC052001 TaxID=3154853 RepID=UPI003447D8FA
MVIVDGQTLLRHRGVALAVPVVNAREMPKDLRIFSIGWDEGRVLAMHRNYAFTRSDAGRSLPPMQGRGGQGGVGNL